MKKRMACLINRVVNGKQALVLPSAMILSLLTLTTFAQPELLRDVNTAFDRGFTAYSSLRSTPTQLFFLDGSELCVSKGTAATTVKLKGFKKVEGLTVVGSMVYFAADDGTGSGTELWKSNGTVNGTVRIRDIFPGLRSSDPMYITAVNSTTIFFSAKNGSNGRELWKTNGTANGTVMVKDIYPVTFSSTPAFITKVNNMVFFSANDGENGIELWKSDGTPSGTVMVKNIYPGFKMSSRPQLLTEVNGKLFFKAHDGISGFELYTSNGSEAGTFMLKDIGPGATSGGVENLVKLNGMLLFTANDIIHGDELWKTNGTASGTVMVKDLNPGKPGSNNTSPWSEPMGNFTPINGVLFFTAGKGQDELFIARSDGTAEGTYRVTNAYTVGLNKLQPCFTYLNGWVYYFNMLGFEGSYYLFQMDLNGRNITALREYLTPENLYAHSFIQEMVAVDNALYSTAFHTRGWNLVKQLEDGKTEVLVSGLGPTSSSWPMKFFKSDSLLYFAANAGAEWDERIELWRTDGTEDGTLRIADLSTHYHEILAVGNRLFFISGDELYVTLGSPETTTRLLKNPGSMYGLTSVKGVVYFRHYTQDVFTQDLWRTDGTIAGTEKVRTFQNIVSITDVGDKAFVLNRTSTGGLELWRTTPNGMTRVKVVRTGDAVNSAYALTAAIGNIFYFVANDGVYGNEVWRSDGTLAGTMMITDLNTIDPVDYNRNETDIRFFTVFNNKLYFSALDQASQWQFFVVTGQNSVAPIAAIPPVYHSFNYHARLYLRDGSSGLWVTDGTVTGGATYLPLAYALGAETLMNGNLYFRFNSTWPMAGFVQMTDCGLVPVVDFERTLNIAEGGLEGLGDDLIFTENYPGYGVEPLIYRNVPDVSNSCPDTGLPGSEVAGNTGVEPWPNPYTDDFSLRIDGAKDETANVVIFDAAGFLIEEWKKLSTNTDYRRLGTNWPKGIYLIKVNRGNTVTLQRVVRK